MTVLKFEPSRQCDCKNLQTDLVGYAERVEALRSPDEVLEELHAVTMRHLPLSVMGAARFPLKSGDWASLQLGNSAFLHNSVPEGWWEEYDALARGRFRPALSLAASSFADATRVAGTRPDLVRAMCETNREALVDALDDALGLIGVARGSLASTGSLLKLAEGGHLARGRFEARDTGLEPMTLQGNDLIEQLLAVGTAGGYVTGLAGLGADLRVQARYPIES